MMNFSIKNIFLLFLGLTPSTIFLSVSNFPVLIAHGFGDSAVKAKFWNKTLYPAKEHYQDRIALSLDYIRDDYDFNLYEIFKCIRAVDFQDFGNLSKSYLGQGQDVQKINDLVELNFKNNQFMLIGHSRGASAIISYVAKYNPENLFGLVLRGTCASIPDLVAFGMSNWFGSIWIANILLKLLSKYPFEKTPEKSITEIKNKNLLIILMHHIHDKKVPYEHCLRLYNEFQKNNFLNVYLLSIADGGHNTHIEEHEYKILNSIYKLHNLPHDSLAAILSKEELQKKYQPSQKKYHKTSFFNKANFIFFITMAIMIYFLYFRYKR